MGHLITYQSQNRNTRNHFDDQKLSLHCRDIVLEDNIRVQHGRAESPILAPNTFPTSVSITLHQPQLRRMDTTLRHTCIQGPINSTKHRTTASMAAAKTAHHQKLRHNKNKGKNRKPATPHTLEVSFPSIPVSHVALNRSNTETCDNGRGYLREEISHAVVAV